MVKPLFSDKVKSADSITLIENNKIVSSCLLILRQARLLPAGLMSIISNVSLDDINHWSFKNDLINMFIDVQKANQKLTTGLQKLYGRYLKMQ